MSDRIRLADAYEVQHDAELAREQVGHLDIEPDHAACRVAEREWKGIREVADAEATASLDPF